MENEEQNENYCEIDFGHEIGNKPNNYLLFLKHPSKKTQRY